MKNLTLHLPKYRLAVQYRLIKRRKSTLDEPIIPTKKRLNLKYRVGGLTRKFFRYFFEHKATKKLLGTNIALMVMVSSFVPSNTLGNGNISEIIAVDGAETPIHTNIAIQNPVHDMAVTQGYKLFHPGLDIDGVTGDDIKPIKKGRVELVEFSKFGYGKHVIVDHGNNLKSLYAHLSKIYVKEDQEVDTNIVIGEMGATGHSFGDHLHLEIRDHGIPINPLSILPIL